MNKQELTTVMKALNKATTVMKLQKEMDSLEGNDAIIAMPELTKQKRVLKRYVSDSKAILNREFDNLPSANREVKFRIIELEYCQFLLTKTFDSESEEDAIKITFGIDGVELNITMGYANEENRDIAFDEFTKEQAQAIVNNMKNKFLG